MLDRLSNVYERYLLKVFDVVGDLLLLVLRLYFGYQFFISGRGKLQSIDRVIAFFTSLGIPAPSLNAYFVATLECVGGVLLIVGLGSRLISSALAINMSVAYLTADRESLTGMFQNPDAFLKADPFLFLLTSLIVVAFGPGRISLDFLIRRWRHPPQSSADAVVLDHPNAA
ncbi:MAG TPA: DoxX family protein [Thermoanaerobaculia bacterium]|nr:DoxX family protein [Thermoanaerobaculia bacterium]